MSAVLAGAVWFAAIFALGFALGAARTLWLAPWIGETAAVAAELPAMLAAAWALCGAVTRRFGVPPGLRPRAAMGATAFALLMTAEFALAAALGRPPAAHAAGMLAPAGALGLFGQIAFAFIPWARGRREGH